MTESSPAGFPTTCWSLVARARDPGSPETRAALEALCQLYWFPIYSMIRRRGYRREDAEDLVQGLVAELLARGDLQAVQRSKGRLRSFLRAATAHYLANARERSLAVKRGGRIKQFSFDAAEAEERYGHDPSHDLTAERLFERQWALTLLERVVQRLQAEAEASGKGSLFGLLRPALQGDALAPSYREVGSALGLAEGTVRVAAHRYRARYRQLLREEIALSVDHPSEVDEEIVALLAAVAAR